MVRTPVFHQPSYFRQILWMIFVVSFTLICVRNKELKKFTWSNSSAGEKYTNKIFNYVYFYFSFPTGFNTRWLQKNPGYWLFQPASEVRSNAEKSHLRWWYDILYPFTIKTANESFHLTKGFLRIPFIF